MSGKKRVTFKDADNEGEASVKMQKLANVHYDHEYQEDDYYCKDFYFFSRSSLLCQNIL